MPAPRKTPKTPEQRIADLERELRLRDERIGELKDEIDESRELVREMEEHAQEHDEYLEMFITTFGLTLNDEGKWGNGEFITGYNALVAQYEDLRGRYNKLVRDFNQYAVPPKPVRRQRGAAGASHQASQGGQVGALDRGGNDVVPPYGNDGNRQARRQRSQHAEAPPSVGTRA